MATYEEENDADIVKIISHEGMQSQFTKASRRGFERRKNGKVWVWIDMMNGVEFDRHPNVINYRGMELSTADGDTFFPRINSKWIDAKHGISRKALETQVGEGIGWMKPVYLAGHARQGAATAGRETKPCKNL